VKIALADVNAQQIPLQVIIIISTCKLPVSPFVLKPINVVIKPTKPIMKKYFR